MEVDRGATYEDGCGVYTSEDGESSNADDVVVEQRGTWLISPDGILKLEIPATRWGISFRRKTERAPTAM